MISDVMISLVMKISKYCTKFFQEIFSEIFFKEFCNQLFLKLNYFFTKFNNNLVMSWFSFEICRILICEICNDIDLGFKMLLILPLLLLK